jgi:hypothetical protein
LVQTAEVDKDEWKEMLNESLMNRMNYALMNQFNDDNVDYDEFVKHCFQIADNLTAPDVKSRRRDAAKQGNKTASKDNTNSSAKSKGTSKPGRSVSGNRAPLDEAESLRRRKEGLCYYWEKQVISALPARTRTVPPPP